MGKDFANRKLLPFFWAGLAWGAATFAVCQTLHPGWTSARWMLALWALSLLDLFSLTRVIGGLLALSGESSTPGQKPARIVQIAFWGVTKAACLGLFVAVLMAAKNAPSLPLFLGLGTLAFVPLAGGLWWSQKELKYAQ